MQRLPHAIVLASIGGVVAVLGCSKTSESPGAISDDAADSGRVVRYEIRKAEGGKGDSTRGYDLIVHEAFYAMPVGHLQRIVVETPGASPARSKSEVINLPDSGAILDTTMRFIVKSPVPPKKHN